VVRKKHRRTASFESVGSSQKKRRAQDVAPLIELAANTNTLAVPRSSIRVQEVDEAGPNKLTAVRKYLGGDVDRYADYYIHKLEQNLEFDLKILFILMHRIDSKEKFLLNLQLLSDLHPLYFSRDAYNMIAKYSKIQPFTLPSWSTMYRMKQKLFKSLPSKLHVEDEPVVLKGEEVKKSDKKDEEKATTST